MKGKKKRAAAEKVAARLARAQAEGLLVRVRRSLPDADVLDGFVVAVGTEWLALARLSDRIELDGWTLLRSADVRAVKLEPDPDCFEIRALRARGQWPPADSARRHRRCGARSGGLAAVGGPASGARPTGRGVDRRRPRRRGLDAVAARGRSPG